MIGSDLPAVGEPMFLVLGAGVNFRSHLDSVDGETFTVAAPLETAGTAVPTPGHQFDVFWMPPRTRMVMPARLVSLSGESPFRWTLAAAGAARQSNRREYVRGGGGVSVRLATADHVVDGALLDISEGGLRCWIDEPLALAVGDHLCAEVDLGQAREVELCGTVLSVREAPHGDPGRHVVLALNPGETLAQMIRLYVMTWEMNERRLERAGAV